MAYTSANEYLQALDQILKKNRGTRVNTLYDTASNVPDQLQTALPIPLRKKDDNTLEPDSIDQLQFNVPQMRQATQGQVQGASTDTQNFLEQLGEIYFSPEVQQNTQPQQDEQQPIIDSENGYLGIDNNFHYEDGTIRESSDPTAYAVGSSPDGGILYSDNSIRRPKTEGEMMSVPPYIPDYPTMSVANGKYANTKGDIFSGSVRSSSPITSFDQYLKLLSGGRLGGQDVTGSFGAEYDLPREKYNIGTDIGTGKYGGNQVNIALPFGAEVVDIKQWDGRNADSTSTPYGNSVLVRLPTGHMMRFSHLSQIGNIKVGDTITPGTAIGVTGETGHAYGKHLDHEMYSPEGQLISTEQFFGSLASQPEIASQLAGSGMQMGEMVSSGNKSQNAFPQTAQSTPQQQSPIDNVIKPIENVFGDIASGASNYIERTKPTGDYGLGITEALKGDLAGSAKEVGKTIEKVNPTGAFDLGISEYLGGNPQLAQEKQKQTAQSLGENVGLVGKSAGLPEMGFSEAISQIPNMFNKPVYAAEMGKLQEKPQANVFSNLLAQAGQGVSNLKNEFGSFMDENIFKKKDLASMGQKNVIGEDTGGAIASNIGDIKSTPADNRNAFFKAGGLDTYKDQLSPGVTSGYRGALNTNLFSDKFYENPDNVANVFGNTAMGGEATGKYRSYMGKQYPVVEGLSPTTRKSEQYLGSYDGLTVDGEYWKDAFMRQGKDVNSGEGKSFQERERQNQQTYSWDEPNQAYYDNEYNRSIMQSIPNVLQSDFKFTAPRTGDTKYGGMSSPQGLYQPVKGDTTDTDKYKDARSIPQVPVSNVFKPQGQMQSVPQVLGASINKPTIPKPVPTPQMSKPQAPAPNSSYNGKSVYNPPPAPSRPSASNYSAPKPAPTPSYSAPKPSYSAPKPVPKPAPAPPRPAPVPTPKPAPKPSNSQSNVFQNLVNYLFGWR